MKISSIVILFILLNISFAEAQNIDSLNKISTSQNEIEKIKALFELSKIYRYDSIELAEKYAIKAYKKSNKINNDTLIVNSINGLCPIWLLNNKTDSLLYYYKIALRLCNKVGFNKGLGVTYNNVGSYYNKINIIDSAIIYYLNAATIFENLKLYKVSAATYNNAGIVYYKQAKYEKALDYFIKSLKLKETILPNGQTVASNTGLAASMVNLGLFYYKLEKNNEALNYLYQANEKAKQANNPNIACIAETNIGIILNVQQKYDSALLYLENALILANKMNSIQRKSTIYSNLANVYSNLQKIDLAIEYSLKSLELHKQTNDIRGVSIVENTIAKLYFKQNNNKLAEKYGLRAFETATKAKDIENQIEISDMLSQIFEKSENYKQALYYKNYYNVLTDSVKALNNNKIIAEMQTKFETEKKNVEIKELKIKDIKNENTKLIYLIVAGLLMAVLLSLIFFFRQKHKINKILNTKNIELEKLNATQNRLMSIISHDFKAPLSAFYSITSSLKSKINIIDKDDINEYLNRMQNSSLGLKLQLENMLNWSISQSTKINVNNSIYNLSVLIHKTTIILEEFAQEKDISLENNTDCNIEINTDGKLLGIVLNNFITNAIKFSKPNEIVKISARKENNKTVISIKDSGIGISPENLILLLSGKNDNSNHKNKGTGLGLIVSIDIIKKLGGKLKAESKIDSGTTFYIELYG